MKPDELAEFYDWYSKNRATTKFDFKKHAIAYCMDDVLILAKGVTHFRDQILEECGIDPFYKTVTIASLAKATFQTLMQKDIDLGIIPTSRANLFFETFTVVNYYTANVIFRRLRFFEAAKFA